MDAMIDIGASRMRRRCNGATCASQDLRAKADDAAVGSGGGHVPHSSQPCPELLPTWSTQSTALILLTIYRQPSSCQGMARKQAKVDKPMQKQVPDGPQGRAKKTEHLRKWPTSLPGRTGLTRIRKR